MAYSRANVVVRIDQAALNRELRSRSGTVGKVVAGFAGLTTVEIKDVCRERAGGAWWKVSSTMAETGRGPIATTIVHKTPPHIIRAKNAPMLAFFWERQNRMFYGKSVNHPGSSPPLNLVLSGIQRASRRWGYVVGALHTKKYNVTE